MRVIFGELRIGRVGHRRIKLSPIPPNSVAKRPRKFLLRVASDPEILRRRDIGRVDGAERRADSQPAGKGLAARRGMAGSAVRGRGQILPALDHGSGLIGRSGRMRDAGHRHPGEKDKQRTKAMTGVAHDQPCLS
jgi:hypothetical protein